MKDNITPIDDPLAKVISISGNTYDWNDKSGKTGKDVGVIAQELEEVLPAAVTTRKNGDLAVEYDRVVRLLMEAIKEGENGLREHENRKERMLAYQKHQEVFPGNQT